MTFLIFRVKKNSTILEASKELSLHGYKDLVVFESPEQSVLEIGASAPCMDGDASFLSLKHVFSPKEHVVSWEEQWELFSPFYDEKSNQLSVDKFYNTQDKYPPLKLLPGAGFGDLSHPTTKLMLKSLPNYITKDSTIYDIGCGSGILSLVAKRLGCKKVCGVEIDDAAIDHARDNVALNKLQDSIDIIRPENLTPMPDKSLILMNMTFEEQKIAISALLLKNLTNCELITSGILSAQSEAYMKCIQAHFSTCTLLTEDSGWCVFYISNS